MVGSTGQGEPARRRGTVQEIQEERAMELDPTQAGKPQRPGVGRPDRAVPTPQEHRATEAPQTVPPRGTDDVEISPEARRLEATMQRERPSSTEIPPERMTQILERIAQGFYSRTEVREEIARRLAEDLGVEPPRS